MMDNFAEKMQRCQTYMEALEEERRKIQVFQRELPLCLELVTQAIETCRQQLATSTEYFPGPTECSEQTSSEGPVLEEFIPLKRSSSSEEEEELNKPNNKDRNDKKADWLKSVQLWNQAPDPPLKQDLGPKLSVVETKKSGGAFHPFERDTKRVTKPTATSVAAAPSTAQATATTSSTAETITDDSRRDGKEGQSHRKPRRCWSPELHRRFLNALQQLGGSHAATPKQIRELMKVDGLTNDEVKSHLQKYRLHTRRPSPAIHSNGNQQTPQFVVVGGLWVPPPDYAAVTATKREANGVAANGIYAPVAPQPVPESCSQQQKKQKQSPQSSLQSEGRSSGQRDDDAHSNSPSASSSTHTTAAASPSL
ncbi:PREDICTED: myb family transcription factor EFM [Nelumbo nucifera]|uniref:Myb family transcription factor EFM n=2 Tax=Nelumbo nucifera TaxID=4432 RepID=A0A1U8AE55_NELNU|nr:PREDICTED: myb family transcription factor EFM [Nelumbo nucifera]DAD31708.1 TPA_asm: hypothetical protein HUJ06_010559 [Nelumbo nucifera]